jgi:hypothetical protein
MQNGKMSKTILKYESIVCSGKMPKTILKYESIVCSSKMPNYVINYGLEFELGGAFAIFHDDVHLNNGIPYLHSQLCPIYGQLFCNYSIVVAHKAESKNIA